VNQPKKIDYATLDEMQAWASEIMTRVPDFEIGLPVYLQRWFVVPRNVGANNYLHRILRDDDDRALHDHPWRNTSYLIFGRYREITPEGVFIREAGDIVEREATALHRLELIAGEPCISLFSTGPKIREWGFDCPQGWKHWKDFTAGTNGELVGPGCGEP
jgi:hypothetical protein